jgi:DegV family protein with EDD domain
MTKVAVLTDSSACLPTSLIRQYSIHVIPLTVLWGDEVLRDGLDITSAEFVQRLKEDPVHPSTTQPNPEDFQLIFEQLSSEYDAIVTPLISSKLSGTVNSAKLAAETFSRVPLRVIDTQSTSMGLGFAVLAAARAAAQGMSLEDIEAAARSAAASARVLFVVDTLEYLHRGGRIGGATKFLGTALSIKPLLHLHEGRVDALEQVRTKGRAIARMLEIASQFAGGQPARAAVVHAGSPAEARALQAQVASLITCEELYTAELSPAISVHTGPGTVGVIVCPLVAKGTL